ncbi:MAG: hypothetical protein NTV09_05875 [Bacteroidetes bacterium]|nr:hypothetical protein [Bacteroidota bacterium]
MKISKSNYEAFFLDYHEGNLSDELRNEVQAFVDSNPDLKDEFESFEVISLIESPVVFSGKEKLKRNTITEFNYKTWFVAYEENDLNVEDRKQVEQFLVANPGYKSEFEILKQAKVLPDLTIRFKNKSSLKKGGAVIPMWVRFAAAACLVIGLISYFVIQHKPKRELATDHNLQNTTPVIPNEKTPIEKIKTVVEGEKEVIERSNQRKKNRKPFLKKEIQNKGEEKLAKLDSIQVIQNENSLNEQPIAFQQQTSNPEQQTTIIINETKAQKPGNNQNFVVLDDNDLTELGLNEKKAEENKSLLADALNGVGKVFGVNAHYNQTHKPLQSKYTETLALGPIAITRTVLR